MADALITIILLLAGLFVAWVLITMLALRAALKAGTGRGDGPMVEDHRLRHGLVIDTKTGQLRRVTALSPAAIDEVLGPKR